MFTDPTLVRRGAGVEKPAPTRHEASVGVPGRGVVRGSGRRSEEPDGAESARNQPKKQLYLRQINNQNIPINCSAFCKRVLLGCHRGSVRPATRAGADRASCPNLLWPRRRGAGAGPQPPRCRGILGPREHWRPAGGISYARRLPSRPRGRCPKPVGGPKCPCHPRPTHLACPSCAQPPSPWSSPPPGARWPTL
jgi:hypothetical protein